MTKESANRKIFLADKKLIDDIYYDFEPRTCNNCKHHLQDKGNLRMYCNAMGQAFEPPQGYGCNRWQGN